MATDRDEQHRQQQELDEIRRSFAEMGARMGSLFEPAEAEAPEGATTPVLPPAPAVERRRPRWQLVGVALLLVLLGTLFGWALAQGGDPDHRGHASRADHHRRAAGRDQGQRARAVRGIRRAGRRGHLPSEPQRP
jgi:hypothetical protein